MDIETYILAVIEGKKAAPILKPALTAMSYCYGAGVRVRNFMYDRILPPTKIPIPIVSVGNIVAGGTGKTPFVHYLAKELEEQVKIAILSRGYRRKGKNTLVINETTSVEECGDEPYFLAKKLPKAQVIVGANRAFSGHLAMVLGAELLLLDDGMQYLQLKRDVEIVVMHAQDLFGKGFYLPRGLLRDSPKRMERAHLIVVNGVGDVEQFAKVHALIRQYTHTPIVAMEIHIKNSIELASKKVGAFCGIASPHRFLDTLKTLGAEVVIKEEKGDHSPFREEELQLLANRALDLGAQCLVCTEKDAVKLPKDIKLCLPIIPVEISLFPKYGKEHLEKLIEHILKKVVK